MRCDSKREDKKQPNTIMNRIDRQNRKVQMKAFYQELLQQHLPKMWTIFLVADKFNLSQEQTRRILKQA